MIKENQKILNRIQFFLDMLVIILSFFMAFSIRFYTGLLPEGVISLSIFEAILPIFAIVPVYLAFYQLMDLYNSRRTRNLFFEFRKIFLANTFGILVLVLFLFVFKLFDFSRYMLIVFFILNIFLTSVSRISIRLLLRHYRKKGYNLKHCLIVGANELGAGIIGKIKHFSEWGYNVIGILDNHLNPGTDFSGIKVLGGFEILSRFLGERHVDIVILSLSVEDYKDLGNLIFQCEQAGVKTHYIPYYYKFIPAKPYIDDIDGIPVIDIRYVPLDNILKSGLKRMLDIVLSLVALIVLSPLFLLCVLVIKFSSCGPVLFRQERVGKNRKNFIMYKFRSMREQSIEKSESIWTIKDDPRRTKWGSFMRKTSIDELPQFINVLRGEMSIVGPRPERPYFVERFRESVPKYMLKHQVRPGITGWAQINGWRGDTSLDKRIEHDLYYIENWTFGLDLKILFLTVFKGLLNRNAY